MFRPAVKQSSALAGIGAVVDCPVILPEFWLHKTRYVYVGCYDGYAIYKTPDELRELDAELDSTAS